jgi:pimeloyl-ACP methyl ester carboxylesterase
MTVETTDFAVPSTDGWTLSLRRHRVPGRVDPQRRPLVLVPGYAMNSFILGFHPRGASLIEYLAADGIEVWTADLRGQGASARDAWRRGTFGLRQLALEDLPRSLDRVRQESGHDRVDLVGCSLGATMVYAFLAHHPQDHGVGHVIAMGGPLRWDDPHPLMKVAFSSPRLAGLLPVKGTRALARVALPVLTRVPALLGLYMNADRIDLSRADQLVNTVEDPVPFINRQMARWIQAGDLIIGGVNVTRALPSVAGPDVLCVLANADGIVPPGAARSVQDILGRDRVEVLEVGTDDAWYAHADLFIGDTCQDDVFEPMRAWLAARA